MSKYGYTAQKRGEGSTARSFLFCVLISAVSVIVAAFAASAVTVLLDDPNAAIGIVCSLSLVLSGTVSGFIISRRFGGVGIAALAAFAVVMVMLCIAAVIHSGMPGISALINYLCFISASSIGGFIAVPRQKKRRPKH